MMNEITLKASLAYDDRHFKETVDAFVAGRSYHRTCKREREKRRRRGFRIFDRSRHFPGKFQGLEGMVTSRIHIDDITTKGFDELVNNKDQHIKVMVTTHKDKI